MNGCLYDAKLHRFLQPDNYVQDATNTQNFNRYGYVLNNPLKYIDPTGEFTWSDLVAAVAIVVGVVVVIASAGTLTPAAQYLIGAGVSHFLATSVILLNEGGSWDNASNYIGIQSPTISFNTDFGYGKDKQNGVYQDVPVVEAKSDVGGEINKDSIPCVQCHHQTTFSLNEDNIFNNFNFNDRLSGFVQYGGEMRSGFIGSSIGKNGVIYNSQDSPFALTDHRTKINFLNYLSDVIGGLGIGGKLVESLYNNENVDFRTFNYTTKDTIWSRGRNPMGVSVRQYILKYEQNKGYIINNDTLHYKK